MMRLIQYKMDSIVSSIIKKFERRAIQGKEKYGTDLDRTDLSTRDWIEHTQDELMDAILYLEKLKGANPSPPKVEDDQGITNPPNHYGRMRKIMDKNPVPSFRKADEHLSVVNPVLGAPIDGQEEEDVQEDLSEPPKKVLNATEAYDELIKLKDEHAHMNYGDLPKPVLTKHPETYEEQRRRIIPNEYGTDLQKLKAARENF